MVLSPASSQAKELKGELGLFLGHGESRKKQYGCASGEEVLAQLTRLFDQQPLEQLARQSRFIERSSCG